MRTRHLDENGRPRYTNRLAHEDSPYLLQHAHNPVDWYPWGEEAFRKAASEDKPVFLSIGYSTCHWCHVMEHESFDDEKVAGYLNEHFVSVKLDREQHPDLDEIYMTGVQLMTGQGGWPMSNFLTSEGQPFFAGTYYPRDHFLAILQRIVEVWETRREDVLKQAGEITGAIERFTSARNEAVALQGGLIAAAARDLLARFDEMNGGFGGAPKFPNESMLLVLLEDWARNGNVDSLNASTRTLDRMYQGGIYDQVAGGFHRYTVDQNWLVPHFEKMLYNQAQLAQVYLKGFRAAGTTAYRRIVEDTLGYVLRDMTAAGGAFFSATDADSEGEEGRFFTWTPVEIDTVLTAEEASLAKDLYGVTPLGNFEGRNILHLTDSLERYAAEHNLDTEDFIERLEAIRRQLYEARESRIHPVRDEKIITAWNGMMISAMALAGLELERDDFVRAAGRAADYVWKAAWSEDRGLQRIVLEGRASIPGNLEDYAYLAEAMLNLYKVSGAAPWLERGERLVHEMIDLFRDGEHGGFFLSRDRVDGGPLILKPKSPMDGATASGNSVALNALVQLSRLVEDRSLTGAVDECLAGFSGLLKASPASFCYMALAAEDFLSGSVSRLQYAGLGHVRVRVTRESERIVLDISMDENWHINAHGSTDPEFPGTRIEALEGAVLGPVDYPGGTVKTAGFRDDPLELYEDRIRIEATMDGGADRPAIALHLQACDERRCLPPESLVFRL